MCAARGYHIRIVTSDAYRATAAAPSVPPEWTEGQGAARLLTPEMLSRRILATTGLHWVRADIYQAVRGYGDAERVGATDLDGFGHLFTLAEAIAL